MELHVTVRLPDPEVDPIERVISGFDDIDKMGAIVATATRRWLRAVQVRKGVQHTDVGIAAYFVEDTPRPAGNGQPRRRRKKGAANGAE